MILLPTGLPDSHPLECVIPDGVLIQVGPPDDEHLLLETCRGVEINTLKKECIKLVINQNSYSKFGTYLPEYATSIVSPVITLHLAHVTSAVTVPTSTCHLTSFTVRISHSGNQISSRRQIMGSSRGTWPNTWGHETPELLCEWRSTTHVNCPSPFVICNVQTSATRRNYIYQQLGHYGRKSHWPGNGDGVLCEVGTRFYTLFGVKQRLAPETQSHYTCTLLKIFLRLKYQTWDRKWSTDCGYTVHTIRSGVLLPVYWAVLYNISS